nr:primosomal protein N' [Bacilli bacterium]
LRLDSDVGEVRNNIQKTLEAFANQEADILVGTQMIAKGHDFPNVTLVGVVLADIGLSLPSFRSTERAFELITQAVGRSGRSSKVGQAIIQTYNPTHYAIQLAARQDYESFYKKEMSIRKISQYPPYTYLTSIEISGKKEEVVYDTIAQIADDMVNANLEDTTILGPVSPYIYHENATYRRLILVKYKNSDKIKPYLVKLLELLKHNTQVNIKINVDPYNF